MDAIVTPVEMAAIDASASEPVEVLVERAGAAVAREALAMLGGAYGRRVVVVAGKGNNGADGRAAARRLERRGVRCRVIDAAAAPPVLPAADLVIDAAYGTGFRGNYVAPALADPTTAVLAVDIPSGVDGTTGDVRGEPLAADRTVTFAALKPGLFQGEGPALAGHVVVADIGLDVTGAWVHLVDDAAVAGWIPERSAATHKWQAAVRLVAGSPGMTGAARLAAAAAMRAGAGYVRLSVPGAAADIAAPTEVVVTSLPAAVWAVEVLPELDRFAALAVGPGLGRSPETQQAARRLVTWATVPTVVDGDGLAALGTDLSHVVSGRPDGAGPVVVTPHDGEYELLTGERPGVDRLSAARSLAAETGAVVLLKGPTTVVATADGRALVVRSGDARLATAGTGDVLTGILSAFLAAGVPAFEAAGAAAHVHGRAGALAWRHGLVAGDLIAELPVALAQIIGG